MKISQYVGVWSCEESLLGKVSSGMDKEGSIHIVISYYCPSEGLESHGEAMCTKGEQSRGYLDEINHCSGCRLSDVGDYP